MEMHSRILIDVLREMLEDARRGPLTPARDTRVRAALLLALGTQSPAVEAVQRLGYLDDILGGTEHVAAQRYCELGAPGAAVTLTELASEVRYAGDEVLQHLFPKRRPAELRAGWYAIGAVVAAFGWTPVHETEPLQYTPERAARLLEQAHSSLVSFKETGDP